MKNIEDDERLQAAKQAVEDHRHAMKMHEISDDRYYTGGGFNRDSEKMQRLQWRVTDIERELAGASS